MESFIDIYTLYNGYWATLQTYFTNYPINIQQCIKRIALFVVCIRSSNVKSAIQMDKCSNVRNCLQKDGEIQTIIVEYTKLTCPHNVQIMNLLLAGINSPDSWRTNHTSCLLQSSDAIFMLCICIDALIYWQFVLLNKYNECTDVWLKSIELSSNNTHAQYFCAAMRECDNLYTKVWKEIGPRFVLFVLRDFEKKTRRTTRLFTCPNKLLRYT